VPSLLKIAKICPIYKSGQKDECSNYRPISILPSFSKILEKLVANRLEQYLSKFKILTPSQFGFRPNYSTSMALTSLYDKISKAIDDNKFAIGVFIDLQKAFDTIDHNILLAKLYFYGICGLSYEWFKDYLSDRQQLVTIILNIKVLYVVFRKVPF